MPYTCKNQLQIIQENETLFSPDHSNDMVILDEERELKLRVEGGQIHYEDKKKIVMVDSAENREKIKMCISVHI